MAVVVVIVANIVDGHLTKIGSVSVVDETTRNGSGNCSSVKEAYGSKGFNDHDVPSQMIPGKLL